MKNTIPDGIWPTMITPFTDKNTIDYEVLEELIEWYIKAGVDGLFAVCQSSEMFYLTLEERRDLAQFVVDKVKGRIPVIASGHISDSIESQVEEMKVIASTGADAAVLVVNQFAAADESDDVWIGNLESFLKKFPSDIPLGFYECPYPYKRLMSEKTLKWCASTGRFMFLKDTSCDLAKIKENLKAVEGSSIKIYNANTATLLQSLMEGASGFSGVMANFFPELYVWLNRNWKTEFEKAVKLQNFLGVASVIESRLYPVCAKQYLQLEGFKIRLHTRVQDLAQYLPSFGVEVEQLHALTKEYCSYIS